MNLTAGKYFLSVVRFQSIRLAAERLRVSPSAISRQIVKLEHEFQEQLLKRRAEGVCLTEFIIARWLIAMSRAEA